MSAYVTVTFSSREARQLFHMARELINPEDARKVAAYLEEVVWSEKIVRAAARKLRAALGPR